MNPICELFGIRYPIISGGMVWCSGWRLASAVSQAGGLGLLGAGSMHPETLREHIRCCREATSAPFGVNIPLMYPQIEEIMQIIADEGVKVVFTSAGSPKKWTGWLHEHGADLLLGHALEAFWDAGLPGHAWHVAELFKHALAVELLFQSADDYKHS